MTLSFLQLNINADNFWDTIIPYLTSHNFDIMHLQEVTGEGTICGNINSKRDTFIELQKVLGTKYKGELTKTQSFSSSPDSYIGNAIFYKKTLTLLEKKEIRLSTFDEFFPSDAKSFEKVGRVLLHLRLEIEDKQLSLLNTHFAWNNTPIEQPHQTTQGEILINYLKTVPKPFIFSGDLNLRPDQPMIQKISSIARNLTTQNKITNTLNPRTHVAKSLFPKGIAVDYIFTSTDLAVKKCDVITEDISDHFGLTATIVI